jgi:hypothetical protein
MLEKWNERKGRGEGMGKYTGKGGEWWCMGRMDEKEEKGEEKFELGGGKRKRREVMEEGVGRNGLRSFRGGIGGGDKVIGPLSKWRGGSDWRRPAMVVPRGRRKEDV